MTYFRAESTIIGPQCLTAVFGMGTGVATWVWSPEDASRRHWSVVICHWQMGKPAMTTRLYQMAAEELHSLMSLDRQPAEAHLRPGSIVTNDE